MNLSIQEIRDRMEAPREAILQCEAAFAQKVESIGDRLIDKPNCNLLLLAGPSSSGKTTSTRLIADYLRRRRFPVTVVSLDNFYQTGHRDANIPRWEDGQPNYETPEALDQDGIRACITTLLAGDPYEMPHFDFTMRRNIRGADTLSLPRGGYLLVEGLHAFHPLVTGACGDKEHLRVLATVDTRIIGEDGATLLSAEDARLVRRLVRDANFRSSPAWETLAMWPYVRKGEERYIDPFRARADMLLDTFHLYEPCVMRPLVMQELSAPSDGTPPAASALACAERLRQAMAAFPAFGDLPVPKSSLLNEFIPSARA